MRINLTYCIQIINFLITYWFLKKFLFKPVLCFIKDRKEKQAKFDARMLRKEHELLSLEKIKQQELANFKIRMKKEYGAAPLQELRLPFDLTLKKDDKDVLRLVDVAKKILVKRVPHVD